MASSFPPRVGTVFADRYQLRELLGSGGVGQVFRAWDLQAQRLVALKVFNPATLSAATWAAYVAVVGAAAQARSPDLVLPQGLEPELSAAPLAAMESLVGEDLATMRARLGRVPWPRAVEIGAQVAGILHAVQAVTGVAHRDLKASNVFVTEAGAVKLLDYGVAEFDAQSADRTRVDSALGIVDYKAPEQLEANIGGHHADVFSLAVLVFEMICGERPFTGASYFVVARKILLEPAPALAAVAPGVPPILDDLLQCALAKRPGDRFADLLAMQRALNDVLRTAPRAAREAAGRTARPVASSHDDEPMTLLAAPRPTRRTGSQVPTGRLKQMVPTGARAVVTASDGEGLSDVNRISETVVARAPTAPPPRAPADRTVVYAPGGAGPVVAREPGVDPNELDDETLRTQIHARDDDPPAPRRGERTLILGDEVGPPRAESTLLLPDDAPPGTLQLTEVPGGRPRQAPESTLQLPGEAQPAASGWTLQRTLIVVNVACGVLILLGLLVLVLGGDPAPLTPEK